MNTLMGNGTQMMFAELLQPTCQKPNVGVLASHAKTSALPENNEGLKETAQACFLELQTFLNNSKKKIDPTIYSLKMYAILFQLIEDMILPDFSLSWPSAGTMQNGKLSILNITEYRKTASEYSLSDILETEVDPVYFLSKEQAQKIVLNK